MTITCLMWGELFAALLHLGAYWHSIIVYSCLSCSSFLFKQGLEDGACSQPTRTIDQKSLPLPPLPSQQCLLAEPPKPRPQRSPSCRPPTSSPTATRPPEQATQSEAKSTNHPGPSRLHWCDMGNIFSRRQATAGAQTTCTSGSSSAAVVFLEI
jgi:hypothetical protein